MALTTAPAERFGGFQQLHVSPRVSPLIWLFWRNDPSKDIRGLAAVEYTDQDMKAIYRSL